MKARKFHLGDVLSITTGLLLSPRHMDGIYDILNFMTGDNLFTPQLPRAKDECKPYLLEQFPQLDSPEMHFAIGELKEMMKTPSGKKEPAMLLLGWLSKLTSGKYGIVCEEMLEVKPLPKGAHIIKDPVMETAETMGQSKKVIVI